MNNQVHKVRGKVGTLFDLCAYFKIVPSDTALKRFKRGWSAERACTVPVGEVPAGRKPA